MVLALALLAWQWSELEIVYLAIRRDSSRTKVLWLSPFGETRPERVNGKIHHQYQQMYTTVLSSFILVVMSLSNTPPMHLRLVAPPRDKMWS
jgi:hypothetical protein